MEKLGSLLPAKTIPEIPDLTESNNKPGVVLRLGRGIPYQLRLFLSISVSPDFASPSSKDISGKDNSAPARARKLITGKHNPIVPYGYGNCNHWVHHLWYFGVLGLGFLEYIFKFLQKSGAGREKEPKTPMAPPRGVPPQRGAKRPGTRNTPQRPIKPITRLKPRPPQAQIRTIMKAKHIVYPSDPSPETQAIGTRRKHRANDL